MGWDIQGKRVLVTGATSGIGLEASVELARRGAKVVMVGRDAKKTEAAMADAKARSGSSEVSALLCDFSSRAAIRKVAKDYRSRFDRLDVLVNNAGSAFAQRQLTADGVESTFAVNHLGYFLLTHLLLDLLVKSAPARIVNTASIEARGATLDFDDLFYEKGRYTVVKAYGRSKLCNVLFTRELGRRLAGKQVTVNCHHPGAVDTAIWSHLPAWMKPLLAVARPLFLISAEEGAKAIVYLATSPEVSEVSGRYFEKNKVASAGRLSEDDASAARLWEVSEKLSGLAAGAPAPEQGGVAL